MSRRRFAAVVLIVLFGSIPAGAREDTLLIEAVKTSDTAAVRALLKTGADANAASVDGTTPLHWAARRDAAEVADLLIRAGAHPDRPNRYGVTPLALAAAHGSGDMIKRLLDAGASAKAVSSDGETPLMTAARSGTTAGVKYLLAGGANVGARENRRGTTALMWAAEAKRADVASLLIEAGANVADRSRGDYSALLIAVRAGSVETVKVLLAAGGDINDSAPAGDPNEQITIGFASKRAPAFGPNDTGAVRTSALVLAMLNGHFPLATWMVNHGADPNAADPRGSALHVLAWLRKPGLPLDSGAVLVPFGNPDTFELARALLDKGARPNARIEWKEIPFDHVGGQVRLPPTIRMGRSWLSHIGATPFWLAAKSSDVPLMRLLLEYGADPRIPAVQNVTPLMAAAGLGFWDAESPAPQNGTPEADTLEAVKLCVELGANVNETTAYGPLTLQNDRGDIRSRYLFPDELPAVAYGDMRWGGATALHGAALRGVNTVVKYLVDQGARLDARTTLGWTPYMVANHVFASNVERSWPDTAAYIRTLAEERGIPTDDVPVDLNVTAPPSGR